MVTHTIRLIDLTVDELRELLKEEIQLASSRTTIQEFISKKVTLQKLCSIYGFAKPTVYQWVSERFIPHSKVGRRLLFDIDQIEKFISDKKVLTKREIEENGIGNESNKSK
jgi:excisionase family DNA binding protein